MAQHADDDPAGDIELGGRAVEGVLDPAEDVADGDPALGVRLRVDEDLGMPDDALRALAANSVRASFASPGRKAELLAALGV